MANKPKPDLPSSPDDDPRLRPNPTCEELHQSQRELMRLEKMAAIGRQAARAAHEINMPLGAIQSSVQNIDAFLESGLFQLPAFLETLDQQRRRDFLNFLRHSKGLSQPTGARNKRQIKRKLRRQLEQEGVADAEGAADALADIGLADITDSLRPLLKAPEFRDIIDKVYQLIMLQRSFQTIAAAAQQAAKVASALVSYARYDPNPQKQTINIVESIETILMLYHNQFKHGVELVRQYGDAPLIECYPDQLNQVWTNLIHNALQAMDNQGRLEISVSLDKRQKEMMVRIIDNGPGIAPDVRPHIFEPFFTTKPAGKGSGLGLDIVKQIIDKHDGAIRAESSPGRTAFTVTLPVQS